MDSSRLELQLKGSCHKTCAMDVFYRQISYIRFIYCDFNIEKMVMERVCSHDKIKIVHKKEASILHELLGDVLSINEMHVLTEPTIKHKSN